MLSKTTLYRMSFAVPAMLAGQIGSAYAIGPGPLTFDFSWTVDGPTGGYVGDVILGTISGLYDNTNNQTNVTITVDASSLGLSSSITFVGGDYFSPTYDVDTGFNVANGEITFASVLYLTQNNTIAFGDNIGPDEYPDLSISPSTYVYHEGSTNAITYTAQAVPVPEPASMALIGSAVAGLAAARRRRRRSRG